MSAFHDPLPPDVPCTQELAAAFDEFLSTHIHRMQEGYDCRPCTHMFIAWLAGREHALAGLRATITAESARALAMFDSEG